MCLTYPVKIAAVENGLAKIEGKDLEVKTALVPDVRVGDWILINAGLALKKISCREAEEINALLHKVE